MPPKKGQACSDTNPCARPFVCGPHSKKCVSRGSDEARGLVKDAFKKSPPKTKGKPRKKRASPIKKTNKTPVKDIDVDDFFVTSPLIQAPQKKDIDVDDFFATSPLMQTKNSPSKNSPSKVSPSKNSPEAMDVDEKTARDWDSSKKQGQAGFTAYCTKKMLDAGLHFSESDLTCPRPGMGFQPSPPQQVVQYLVHPETTIERLLVAHRTGLGKTYSMILALDNFYSDPRAKVVIFPVAQVADNFYEEIMKFPSKYRDFVRVETGISVLTENSPASAREKIVDALALKGRRLQAMAGLPHPKDPSVMCPAAPLRAERYTRAGGSTVLGSRDAPSRWPRPENMLFRWRVKDWHGGNPYSNMIVFMDEFHNLLKPDAEVLRYAGNDKRIERMRYALGRAENSVIMGLTATPIIDDPMDARAILDLIKGVKYADASDEGFMSYFQALPEAVFASVTTGKPPQHLPKIVHVSLNENDRQLQEYLQKEKQYKDLTEPERMLKLMPLMSSGIAPNQGFDKSMAGYKRLKTERESVAKKLTQIVRDVMSNPKKTLILIHSRNGFKQMRAIWELEAAKRKGVKCPGVCWIAHGQYDNKKQKATIDKERDLFNNPATNATGQKIQVIIADAKFYEAGVSFKQVRRLILADVPTTWASYMQRIGRVLRFCGHDILAKQQRKVELLMYVCTSKILDTPTPDEFFVQQLERENGIMSLALDGLRMKSVDAGILDVFHQQSSAAPRFSPMMYIRGSL